MGMPQRKFDTREGVLYYRRAGIYPTTNFMELEDVDLAAQLNGGESHSLAQKPGVETRLEILNLRGKLGGEGRRKRLQG